MTTPTLSVVPFAEEDPEVTVLVCSSCRHPDEPESETRPGSALALAFLSHLAVDADRPETAVALIAAARARAAARGVELLSLGLARGNPMLPAVRRAFPARELVSVLYLVHRPEAAPAIGALGGRCPHLEVAVL